MKIPDSPGTIMRTEPIPLVYIQSAAHSGSTLLALQLGRHPQVVSVGELSGTPKRANPGYRCSCGAELARCEFWADISAGMAQRGFSYRATTDLTDVADAPNAYARRLLRPLHRGPFLELVRDVGLALSPAARAHLRRHQALKAALAESVVERTGKPVLVDSSKSGVQLKYLLRNPRFQVKVVWLLRDGRGVARSLMRNQRKSMRRAAYQWRRSNEEAQAIVARLPRHAWTHVRYEDLCTAPEATLEAAWRFVGVAPRPPENDIQHVLGHSSRLEAQRREIALDEKWRVDLSAEDLRVFDEVAGRMNRRLGYGA